MRPCSHVGRLDRGMRVQAQTPRAAGAPTEHLQDLIQVNAQGIQEYQSRQFDQAKGHFEQVATGAPNAAEAHYNLGLALFALGESDQAREHFIEAANLAPGDKVIWDSPALRAYGSPDANIQKQQKDPIIRINGLEWAVGREDSDPLATPCEDLMTEAATVTVGEKAPSFSLPDQSGKKWRSKA